MTRPLIAISTIAMTAALSAAAPGAKAEAIDLYFSAAPYTCNGPEFAAEWRVAGDSAGTLSIQAFERRSDLNGANFSGVEWQVNAGDLAAPLNLTNRNNQPQWRISGLLDGEPSIVPVSSNGEPKANCSPVFEATGSAEQRFQDVFTLLDTAAPSPDDAQRVVSQVSALPPVNMLPELQQSRR